MFRVVTLNANGLRSAANKGLFRWLKRVAPDVVCLQEVKAHECDIPTLCRPTGWQMQFNCAARKGYSGTAIYSIRTPRAVRLGFGVPEFDAEGRYIEVQFAQITVVSVYFPSGSAGPARQASKFRFLNAVWPHLKQLAESGREVIVCGDINIAHREIDLKNWRSNRKNSGFLPEEREWMTQLLDAGWVDVFRRLDPAPERYTWWSSRGQARANNVGWRIDYQLATPGVAKRAKTTQIYVARRFSDHAPLLIDYSGRL